MYYKSRSQAGKLLAVQLQKYAQDNTAVIALSEGGLEVGAEIARHLHSSLGLLLTQDIKIPGESVAMGAIDEMGTFTHNRMYSAGQLEAFSQEYLTTIEQEKMRKLHAINRVIGRGGFIRPRLLEHHTVIVVSDGANSGLSFDVALNYLKPIALKRLHVAVPVASIAAIDRLHVMFDEISCLSVKENYIATNHYFEDNDFMDRNNITSLIDNIAVEWIFDTDPSPVVDNALGLPKASQV